MREQIEMAQTLTLRDRGAADIWVIIALPLLRLIYFSMKHITLMSINMEKNLTTNE